MNLSERIERANELLHPRATPHQGRLGREHPDTVETYRFPFARDIARIIHSTAFRRLQGKMQVFPTGVNDHRRTRLAHTEEVAQASFEFARGLRLNEDVARAMGLLHDLAHPPYGHTGEDALDECMKKHDPDSPGFNHNRQCYRLVTKLEHHKPSRYLGLNLNRELLDGTLKHDAFHPETGEKIRHVPEAQLNDKTDGIIYLGHDTEDALDAGLFSMDELLDIPLAREAHERIEGEGTTIRGAIISILGDDMLKTSTPLLESDEERCIAFSESMQTRYKELYRFHIERIYNHPNLKEHREGGKRMIRELFDSYMRHPSQDVERIQRETDCSLVQAVADNIGMMSDRYMRKMHAQIA